jgi:hypothetical protein
MESALSVKGQATIPKAIGSIFIWGREIGLSSLCIRMEVW